jgi:hypothetical protein
MKRSFFKSCLVLTVLAFASFSVMSQSNSSNQATDKPALEILSFKIGNNYYPLLDHQPSTFSAEVTDIPQTEAEKIARRNAQASRGNSIYNQATPRGVLAPEDLRTRGRLQTTIRVIDLAEWVNLSIRNTSTKTIKAIEWDFAFPRREGETLILRYEVSHKADIKPGGKKTLKHPLPPGAMNVRLSMLVKRRHLSLSVARAFKTLRDFHKPLFQSRKSPMQMGVCGVGSRR